MFFRSEDESGQVSYTSICPYYQYLYRQFPPMFPGGLEGPAGLGPPGGVPPFFGGMGGPFAPPSAPPPSLTPAKPQIGIQAVSPRTIRRCLFRFTYIWVDTGRSFWAYLIYADRRSVAGWRWNGRRWVYFGLDIRRIDSFECY